MSNERSPETVSARDNRPISIEVSSLFPIDLTACVFYNYAYGPTPVRILLNTELATGTTARAVAGVSRGSFPIYECDHKGLHDWQVAHTTEGDGQTQVEQFLASLAALRTRTATCDKSTSNRIAALEAITLALLRDAAPKPVQWPQLAQEVISYIYKSLMLSRPIFEDISYARRDGLLTATQRQLLYAILSKLPESVVTLSDGGAIEAIDRKSGVWKRGTAIRRSGSIVTLLNAKSKVVETQFSLTELNFVPIRLKGALELVLSAESTYLLPDFPWYLTNFEFDSMGDVRGVEVISPISVKSALRTTNRLHPSGYIVTDYGGSNSWAFATSIMGHAISGDYFRQDLERLSRRPPQSNVRLTKSQTALRQMIAKFEIDIKQEMSKNHYKVTDQLNDIMTSSDQYALGQKLVTFCVILELSKPSKWKPEIISAPSVDYLRSLCGVDKLSSANLVNWARQVSINHFGLMLSRESTPIKEASIKALNEVAERWKDVGSDCASWPPFITCLARWALDNALAYYSWFAAQVTGNLKAHLVLMYVLFDAQQLRTAVETILEARRVDGRESIYFAPRFWIDQ